MKCPACHAEIENPNAKFCNECGQPIPQHKICSGCGKQLNSNAKFCDECGTLVAAVKTKKAEKTVPVYCAGSGKPITASTPHFKCLECEKLYLESQRFEDKPICQNCAYASGVAQKLEKARSEKERLVSEEKAAKAKAEAERLAIERAQKEKQVAEARAKAEEERKARERTEAEARAKAEEERKARERIEAEARAKAEEERKARERTEAEARAKAEEKRLEKLSEELTNEESFASSFDEWRQLLCKWEQSSLPNSPDHYKNCIEQLQDSASSSSELRETASIWKKMLKDYGRYRECISLAEERAQDEATLALRIEKIQKIIGFSKTATDSSNIKKIVTQACGLLELDAVKEYFSVIDHAVSQLPYLGYRGQSYTNTWMSKFSYLASHIVNSPIFTAEKRLELFKKMFHKMHSDALKEGRLRFESAGYGRYGCNDLEGGNISKFAKWCSDNFKSDDRINLVEFFIWMEEPMCEILDNYFSIVRDNSGDRESFLCDLICTASWLPSNGKMLEKIEKIIFSDSIDWEYLYRLDVFVSQYLSYSEEKTKLFAMHLAEGSKSYSDLYILIRIAEALAKPVLKDEAIRCYSRAIRYADSNYSKKDLRESIKKNIGKLGKLGFFEKRKLVV